jgi:uncharacterized membrane protein
MSNSLPDMGNPPPQFTPILYLQRGWQQFQGEPGPAIGFTAVALAISLVLGLMPLGSLVSSVIGGPLFAGYYLVGLQQSRGQSIVFSDFFRGFNRFGDFFLINLLIGLVTFAACIPGLLAIAIAAILGNWLTGLSDAIQLILAGVAVLAIVLLLLVPVIYLSVSYMLAIPLVADRTVKPWPAMESSRRRIGPQWLRAFALVLLISLVNLLGLLPCGLGLLLTLPWSYATILAAYEDQFGQGTAVTNP